VIKKVEDEEFIAVWKELGSPAKISDRIGLTLRNVYERRRVIEKKYNILLPTKDARFTLPENRKRATLETEGYVIVFSDAHFMPGEPSAGFNALLKLIKTLKPKAIIANGDILDGKTISKYGPMDWEPVTSLRDELEAVQWHMDKIVKACKGLVYLRFQGIPIF